MRFDSAVLLLINDPYFGTLRRILPEIREKSNSKRNWLILLVKLGCRISMLIFISDALFLWSHGQPKRQ